MTLWSRHGRIFTDQFRQLADACEHLPSDTLLDGEIVAFKDGRISFNLLQRHQASPQAIVFYAFDLIIHRASNLIKLPLENRREILAEVMAELKPKTPLICISEIIGASPAQLIRLAKEFGFKGIIAKRNDSCYEIGLRSGGLGKVQHPINALEPPLFSDVSDVFPL